MGLARPSDSRGGETAKLAGSCLLPLGCFCSLLFHDQRPDCSTDTYQQLDVGQTECLFAGDQIDDGESKQTKIGNRETEEKLGGGGFDQSQSQTHKSFVGSPCAPVLGGGRRLVGRDAWKAQGRV